MNKKIIALKLLKSPTARRVIARGLRNPQVRSLVLKQLARRLRF